MACAFFCLQLKAKTSSDSSLLPASSSEEGAFFVSLFLPPLADEATAALPLCVFDAAAARAEEEPLADGAALEPFLFGCSSSS